MAYPNLQSDPCQQCGQRPAYPTLKCKHYRLLCKECEDKTCPYPVCISTSTSGDTTMVPSFPHVTPASAPRQSPMLLPEPKCLDLYGYCPDFAQIKQIKSQGNLRLDVGNYDNDGKCSLFPAGSTMARRQYHFNIVGYNQYSSACTLSFNYTYPSGLDIIGADYKKPTATSLPKELLDAIRDLFGFLIYEYETTKPIILFHYPAKETAYREYACRFEFLRHHDEHTDIGYTVEFLRNSWSLEISKAIEAHLQKGVPHLDRDLDHGFYINRDGFKCHRANHFKNYRELRIKDAEENTRLRTITIDPNNTFGVTDFNSLYRYIKSTPLAKATGTFGDPKKVPHLEMTPALKYLFTGKYAPSSTIPGDEIYTALSLGGV